MIRVAVTSKAFSRTDYCVKRLKQLFPGEVRLNSAGYQFSPENLINFLQDCQYSIVGLDQINEQILSSCPHLKLISKYGVGINNIDFESCKKHNVKVVYSKGVNCRSVAEEVVGCMLSLIRNLYVSSNKLKFNNEWIANGGRQLSKKKIGIIGFGFTGSEVVNLLTSFNCEFLINDIIDKSNFITKIPGAKIASKEEIYKEADIITIHTDLNESTINMINAKNLKIMKESVIIINIARGGIVNENDLKTALLDGKIAGAALDVYSTEPPNDKQLLSIPNLMCMPHIGGNSLEAIKSMGDAAIDNLLKEIK